MMTFAPSFAGGFMDQRLSCIGDSTSSKPGEIQSAGLSNSTSLTLLWSRTGYCIVIPTGCLAYPICASYCLTKIDDPILPLRGVAPIGWLGQSYCLEESRVDGPAARRLVGDLVEDVGQVLDGIDNFADVRLLQSLDARIERQHLIIVDRGDANIVDVVGGVKRMTFDVVRRETEVEPEALEEHHRDVDAPVAGGDDVVVQPVEVSRVELREVELRFAVPCRSGPGAGPRLRRHAEVEGAPGDLRPELLPTPQPDKVVAALLEELKITAVVVPLRDLGAIAAGTGPIVEVVVDMRSGQIHRSPVGCVARCDREVAWVGLRDHERPNGGIRS